MPRLLDPPEGNARIRSDHLIDENHARLKFSDEPLALGLIACPGAGAQAEAAVVGEADGFIDILDSKQQRDRPKKFLIICGRVLGNFGQYRRGEEVAGTVETLASG
jgi:hypothetical protein